MKALYRILKESKITLEPMGSNQKNKSRKVTTQLYYVMKKPNLVRVYRVNQGRGDWEKGVNLPTI